MRRLKKKDEKIDTKKLVGKWRLKDDKEGSMILDFGKDGRVTITFKYNDKEDKSTGSYKVEGNTLNYGHVRTPNDVRDRVGSRVRLGPGKCLRAPWRNGRRVRRVKVRHAPSRM